MVSTLSRNRDVAHGKESLEAGTRETETEAVHVMQFSVHILV